MKVKELIRQLKTCDGNPEMVFYYLKNTELRTCEIESLLDDSPYIDGRFELTIKEEGSNENGDMEDDENE